MTRYGLKEEEINWLGHNFAQYPEIEEVVLYGSRAKGCHKPFSDVDITLKGSKLTRNILRDLQMKLYDSIMPYEFDVSLFATLKNEDLIDHINRCGIIIYSI